MSKPIFIGKGTLFKWGFFIHLDLNGWNELYVIGIKGNGEKRYIFQVGILEVECIWHESDVFIKSVGGKYVTWERNPKYLNDPKVTWSWDIKDGYEKFNL